MRIILSCPVLRLADLDYNLQQISEAIRDAAKKGADLVLFAEAALTGFEALNFDYERDLDYTLGLRGPAIAALQAVCRQEAIACGCGFHENERGGLYSSYLVIDKQGEIADLYHRVSPGWKEPGACADYREGLGFHTFSLEGKTFASLICGDFWEDKLVSDIILLDQEVDAFIWACHLDFDPQVWASSNSNLQDPENFSKDVYIHQSSILAKPVLFLNNYVAEDGRAKGGLYYWEQGREKAALPMGKSGSLLLEL